MIVSDLDGTLLNSQGLFSQKTVATLKSIGNQGVLRAIATGRSAFSARKVIPAGFPIDYLIFSSGAGILNFKTGEILVRHHMEAAQIKATFSVLVEKRHHFMIHAAIPDNHHFQHFGTGNGNPDFRRRCTLYSEFGKPGVPELLFSVATQFLVVVPPSRAEETYEDLTATFPHHSVIRASSPLDKVSGWIEIFDQKVSKGRAAAWLAERLGVSSEKTLAVGNDYNDIDLLAWAGTSYLVANAAPELKGGRVASNEDDGFVEAVSHWKKKFGK